jgi:hypothetical protein
LVTGNPAVFEAVDDVGGIPGGQLGLDEGPQHFLGCPALRLRDDQDFGGGAPDRSQFEPAQAGVEIGCQCGN